MLSQHATSLLMNASECASIHIAPDKLAESTRQTHGQVKTNKLAHSMQWDTRFMAEILAVRLLGFATVA